MNKISTQLIIHWCSLCALNGLSGCDDYCIGQCTGPANAEGGNTGSPGDNNGVGAGDGADETGGGVIPDLCSYPAFAAFAGLANCDSVPYLAMPLRGTDTVPPSSTYTLENIEGSWERSTYNHDEWAKLQGHLDFRGALSIPTQGHTHFSVMAATDECSEGWWSETLVV